MHVFTIIPSYEFVVLACDGKCLVFLCIIMCYLGLWDVLSPQECVNFVRRKLFETNDVDCTASALVNKALERGSLDNVSVIICCFHQQD